MGNYGGVYTCGVWCKKEVKSPIQIETLTIVVPAANAAGVF